MRKLIDKYGLVNVIISVICCIVFVLNNLIITKDALLNINENTVVAYLLNFLLGCEGVLGKWGSMSYSLAIKDLQLWRVVTHAYLHGGIFHLGFNLAALLVIGKYVEKSLGSVKYAIVYHVITIIGALVCCCIFTESNSVGASGGIFGMIGIALVMCIKKQLKLKKSEVIYLIIFVAFATAFGLESLVLHMFGLVLGVIFGLVMILKYHSLSA